MTPEITELNDLLDVLERIRDLVVKIHGTHSTYAVNIRQCINETTNKLGKELTKEYRKNRLMAI